MLENNFFSGFRYFLIRKKKLKILSLIEDSGRPEGPGVLAKRTK